jgi:hypothetical protein
MPLAMDTKLKRQPFLKWASSSFFGHVVLCELLFSLPLALVFMDLNHADGKLTPSWAFYLVVVWALLGMVGAALVWFTISLPLLKRRQGGGR